jgi:hypothetical protein
MLVQRGDGEVAMDGPAAGEAELLEMGAKTGVD